MGDSDSLVFDVKSQDCFAFSNYLSKTLSVKALLVTCTKVLTNLPSDEW